MQALAICWQNKVWQHMVDFANRQIKFHTKIFSYTVWYVYRQLGILNITTYEYIKHGYIICSKEIHQINN